MKKFVCKHPWSHFEVNNPNGEVTMCCNNDTVLGNVHDNSIEEVWNAEPFQKVRARMRDEGAYAMCPHTCPVLQGGKQYENLDGYSELDAQGSAHRNAVKNEEEFAAGKTDLVSLPRWLRFAYSWACNLDCYHCYQREEAKVKTKLPDSFMVQLPEYARTTQVILPFGGEPFYFKPVVDFIENLDPELETRFYFVTNAVLLNDRMFKVLERVGITCIAVSLDAATAESYDTLRVRGRNAQWEGVMANLGRFRDLKKEKGFLFTVSMTLNSTNCAEIETFVDLALSHDAEPLITLVANPDQTMAFQKEFLTFSPEQIDSMFAQIDRSLPKVTDRKFQEAETGIHHLRAVLMQHRDFDNSPARFVVKNTARKIFHALPEPVREPIRRIVQSARAKRFERYTAR